VETAAWRLLLSLVDPRDLPLRVLGVLVTARRDREWVLLGERR
jgi:hypothetical protein